MSRSSALILLGVLVIVAPLSGLPQSWIAFLLALIGIVIVLVGIALRADNARRAREAAYTPNVLPVAESSPAEEPVAPENHDHHHPSSIA